jgi:hypothetical protein
MRWLKSRFSFLWEASAYYKLLLTLAATACIILGTVDQLKFIGKRAISPWVALPQNAGDAPVIFGFSSWILGILLALLFFSIWMLEVAWRYRQDMIPNINLSFDKNGMGIVLALHQIRQTGPTPETIQEAEWRASYVRIRVDALSKSTVKGCTAYITALEKRPKGTTAFTPVPIPQSISLRDQQFDIIPAVPHLIDFLRSGEWDNKVFPTCAWPLILRDVFNDEGTYRFTFIVNGDGLSKTMQMDVTWQGRWDSITGDEVHQPR